MLDEKMKLEEYFKEEIQRVSDIQISGIEREIEQIRKKTIASLEQSAQTEAGMLRETELREKQSEHAIALSRLHEDTNRKLMAKRKELNEAVFDEVKQRMLAYCESEAYKTMLLDKLDKLAEHAQEHAVLHMAKKDERYVNDMVMGVSVKWMPVSALVDSCLLVKIAALSLMKHLIRQLRNNAAGSIQIQDYL